jgi:hypothetical protein
LVIKAKTQHREPQKEICKYLERPGPTTHAQTQNIQLLFAYRDLFLPECVCSLANNNATQTTLQRELLQASRKTWTYQTCVDTKLLSVACLYCPVFNQVNVQNPSGDHETLSVLDGTTYSSAPGEPIVHLWTKLVSKYMKGTFPFCLGEKRQNTEL